MTSTADRILDVTQELIQTQGYNAISFNHIAELVDIRKPSIVHHFPSKAALGCAVVKRYREQMNTMAEQFFASGIKTSQQAFDFYCLPFMEFAATENKICLCGALGGEFFALPEPMQLEVRAFFEDHKRMLAQVFQQGQQQGEIKRQDDAVTLAQLTVSALQGALITQRATGTPHQVANVVNALRLSIFAD